MFDFVLVVSGLKLDAIGAGSDPALRLGVPVQTMRAGRVFPANCVP